MRPSSAEVSCGNVSCCRLGREIFAVLKSRTCQRLSIAMKCNQFKLVLFFSGHCPELQSITYEYMYPEYHPVLHLSTQISLPLGQHPRNGGRRHDQRAQESSTKRSIAEDKLSDKMCQRNAVCPNGEVVGDRGGDVVGGGHAHHC